MVSFTCQADLEEKILSLEAVLAERDEQAEILVWDLSQCKEQRAELEHKYQSLYDQQFESLKKEKESEEDASSADEILREEIEALKNEVTNYRRQALIWQDLSHKYQAATTDLQEQLSSLRSEASVTDSIKAQRDGLAAEHAIAVEKIAQLESKLEDDLYLQEKLHTAEQLEKATTDKLGNVTACNIVLELEMADMKRRLQTCGTERAELMSTIRTLESERNSLRALRDSKPVQEDEDTGTYLTLADELTNYKEAYHQVQKELLTQKMQHDVLKSDSEEEAQACQHKIELLKSDSAAVRRAFEGLQVELEAQRDLYDELSNSYTTEVEKYRTMCRKVREDASLKGACLLEQDLKAQEELHAVELDGYKRRIAKLKSEREAQEVQLTEQEAHLVVQARDLKDLKHSSTQLKKERDECRRAVALLERDLRKQDERLRKYQEGTRAKLNQFRSHYQRAKQNTSSQVAHFATHVDSLQPSLKAY